MDNINWTNDWPSFVRDVCANWDAGLSDSDVTAKFANRKITWEGIVADVQENYDSACIVVDLPAVSVKLNDGRWGEATRILLYFSWSDVKRWEHVWEGDRIRFETEINDSDSNPFRSAGIEWSAFQDTKGSLSVSTCNSRLVEVVEFGRTDHSQFHRRPSRPPLDPLEELPNYKHCWDGSEPGWTLRGYPVILCKFTVEFDEVLGPTDAQIEFLRTISDSLAHGSSEDARKMIGNETRFVVPSIQDWAEEDLERITEQLDELGLGGEGGVDRRWSQLIPVSPSGTELLVDDKSLRREIVRRMANAGVPIEGDKKIVEWWWFLGYYVRLE